MFVVLEKMRKTPRPVVLVDPVVLDGEDSSEEKIERKWMDEDSSEEKIERKRMDEESSEEKIKRNHMDEESYAEKINRKRTVKANLHKIRQVASQKKALKFSDGILVSEEIRLSGMIKVVIDVLKEYLLQQGAKMKVYNEVSKLTDGEKLKTLFELVDVEESGDIDVSELMDLQRKYGSYSGVYFDLAESIRNAARRIKSFDRDNNSRLDMEEFKAMVPYTRWESREAIAYRKCANYCSIAFFVKILMVIEST